MTIYSSIVEYNPFHYGHLYHLNKIKSFKDCEGVVVVMSGNFVQRGEPALVDKWSRTEIALKNGADLILELPFIYSIQDARGFALGAVSILEKTGIINKVVFGSESSEIDKLKNIANILIDEPEELKNMIKNYLKKGFSFPNARKYALKDFMNEEVDIIEKSNDILGVEYIYSLLKLNSQIEPITIKRKGANYNDTDLKENFSSASAIRKYIKENQNIDINIPKSTKEILQREFDKGKGPIFYEDIHDILLAILNVKTKEELGKIHGVTEGIENRIKKYISNSQNIDELLFKIKTKRFTYTRLKRTLLNILFGITKQDIINFNTFGPQYIKILGFNDTGKMILSKMRKSSSLPIINLSSQFYRTKKMPQEVNYKIFRRMFELELTATQIYKLLFKDKNLRKTYTDFREPIYIKTV